MNDGPQLDYGLDVQRLCFEHACVVGNSTLSSELVLTVEPSSGLERRSLRVPIQRASNRQLVVLTLQS
jgi:hypothetical protein